MKYQTRNEFEHFTYEEARIGDVERLGSIFHLWLDNAGILPENSCNRDIRKMRCNAMCFKILDASIVKLVEEGYRYYDANGKLLREDPDRELAPLEYADRLALLREGWIVSFERKTQEEGFLYTLAADGSDEKTYCITISGSGDEQEWDRFLSLE